MQGSLPPNSYGKSAGPDSLSSDPYGERVGSDPLHPDFYDEGMSPDPLHLFCVTQPGWTEQIDELLRVSVRMDLNAEEEEEEITYPFSPSCSGEQHSFRGGRRLQPGDPDADAGGGGDSGAYGDLDEATRLRMKCDDFDQYKETVPTSRQMPYSPCRLCNAFAVSAAAPVRRAPYISPPPPRSG